MPSNESRERFKKLPRQKSFIGPMPAGQPRRRRPLLDRLADPGVMAVALAWAASGLSNHDISIKLGCSGSALNKSLQSNPAIRKRFERARLELVEAALAGMRGKLKSDWRASAFVLERMRPGDWGDKSGNSVDLRKLFSLLSKLAASINGVIPESSRAAVDAIVADFIDTLAEDGDASEAETPEGTPE